MKYYVPNNVSIETLANGRPMVPGQVVDLNKEDEKANQRHIDEGRLVKTEEAKK